MKAKTNTRRNFLLGAMSIMLVASVAMILMSTPKTYAYTGNEFEQA